MLINVKSAHDLLTLAQMIAPIGSKLISNPALWHEWLDLEKACIHVLPDQLKGSFVKLPFFHDHRSVAGEHSENHLPGIGRVMQCLGA
jgi:hypothetical protein